MSTWHIPNDCVYYNKQVEGSEDKVRAPGHCTTFNQSCASGECGLADISLPYSASMDIDCLDSVCESDPNFCLSFGNPDYCALDMAGYNQLSAKHKAECENEYGGTYVSGGAQTGSGLYCVSSECHDNCAHQDRELEEYFYNECCESNSVVAPSSLGPCGVVIASGGSGVWYQQRAGTSPTCGDPGSAPAGYCNQDQDDPSSDSSDDGKSSNSNNDNNKSSNSGSGKSSGSQFCALFPDSMDCFCKDNPDDPACAKASSPGGGSSGSGGDGCDGDHCASSPSSSPSGGGGSSGSSGGGYWCDDPENKNDPICTMAGYDFYCEIHYDDPFCVYSRFCSQNPKDPNCGNPRTPQPPPREGWGTGGGSSAGSGGDGDGGISCKDLKNCDWSTWEEQIKQIAIDQATLDTLKAILAALKAGQKLDSSQVNLLEAIRDSLGGFGVVADSLSSGFGGVVGAIGDMVRSIGGFFVDIKDYLQHLFGAGSVDGDYPDICKNNPHLIQCGGGGSGGSAGSGDGGSSGSSPGGDLVSPPGEGLGVDSTLGDLSRWLKRKSYEDSMLSSLRWGTVDGIAGGIDSVNYGIGETNRLLGRIDSLLSSGDGDLGKWWDSLAGSCVGDYCGGVGDGDFAGVGEGAFAGLDTSGLSARRYDSLLSAPGSAGLRDSVAKVASDLRSATAVPFVDNVACPANDPSLVANPCAALGGECRLSLCDSRFYVKGRHALEWVGLFFEFAAWVVFLVRVA
jgi:hypothetical protein